MKTAISIPNLIFDQAEKLAQQMHVSRSALYVAALKEFIKMHHKEVITQKLNNLYQKELSSMDKELLTAQTQILDEDSW